MKARLRVHGVEEVPSAWLHASVRDSEVCEAHGNLNITRMHCFFTSFTSDTFSLADAVLPAAGD